MGVTCSVPEMGEDVVVEGVGAAALTDLLYASAGGKVDIVERLLAGGGAKVNDVNYDGRSALHVAASDGQAAVVAKLIDAKAEVNPKDRWGRTPLDEANRIGNQAVCKALLDAGGAPSAHLTGGCGEVDGSPAARVESSMAVCCAAAAGSLQLLQELHKGGASVDSADYDGRSALIIAASHGRTEVVKWLLEMKANVNAKDEFGFTASAEASRHGHKEILAMLMEAGAEPGDMAEMKHQAEDEAWAVPLSEITIEKELSKTLKSVIYIAKWRGTTVVCKSAGELHTDESGHRMRKQLTAMEADPDGQSPEESRQELVREIGLLRTLRHPDLVMFLGACVEHQPPLVLTEFMEGGDLERYYRAQAQKLGHPYRPETSKLLKWSSSVARGLAFLHESHPAIIHRDLKPLNLLLNAAGELKVTDFGISKLMGVRTAHHHIDGEEDGGEMKPTMSGGVGTWRYMAPEVVRYEQYDDRADIYSYALILWFMSTGRQPFVEQFGSDAGEVLKSYTEGKEPRPEAAAMKCPSAFRGLVQDCWHVTASSRPSAVECTRRLAAIVVSHHDDGMMDSLKRHLTWQ